MVNLLWRFSGILFWDRGVSGWVGCIVSKLFWDFYIVVIFFYKAPGLVKIVILYHTFKVN